MKEVTIYTDGGCSPNPGEGAWAAILQFGQHNKEICGYTPESTNSRMELTGAINALKALNQPCEVNIWCDSQYVVNGMSEWIYKWLSNGWRNAQKKPVDNQDLWKELLEAAKPHQITWNWVQGHSGHPINERVDKLVRITRARKGL